MAKRSFFTDALLAATSFASGMAIGLLLAPRSGEENRRWINRQASELADWASAQRYDMTAEGGRRLNKIRRSVHQGIKDNVPDLYEATEDLGLKEEDLSDA